MIAIAGLIAGAFGAALLSLWRQPEVTPALRGRLVAEKLGCFACHGPEGVGGIGDASLRTGKVPGWDGSAAAMYARSEESLREWILYGAPREESSGAAPGSPRLILMPAYEGLLTERELADLSAYFHAVSGWDPGMPDSAFEGRKAAERLGCFGCHGPSGMGGARNPGSFTGAIPPWDGRQFEELVRDDTELREWILDGRVRRLWENPLARHFLEGQKTRMPAYRDRVSEDEVEKLAAFIRWLRTARHK